MKYIPGELVKYEDEIYYYIREDYRHVNHVVIQDYIGARRIIVHRYYVSKVSSNRDMVSMLEKE